MDNTTYNIQKQARKDDQQAARWLKDNGLNAEYFADIELHLVQAQQIATNHQGFTRFGAEIVLRTPSKSL